MAAILSKLNVMLECRICLNTYHIPKHLNCGHTYCQDCLDGILIFKEDGSAELNCPLRCRKKTLIGQGQTTSSLPTTYCLTEILDEMRRGDEVNSTSDECKDFKQPLIHSSAAHDACNGNDKKNTNTFTQMSSLNSSNSRRLYEIQPFCAQHKLPSHRVCTECDNMFVCVYCVHRTHKSHKTKSVTDFGFEIRNWFEKLIASRQKKNVAFGQLTRKYNEALMNLDRERKKFMREMEERKLKKMAEYLKMLKKEGQKLLKEFDEKTEEFKIEVIAAVYTANTQAEEMSDCLTGLNSKSNFELITDKTEIQRGIHKILSLPENIPIFNSHLHEVNDEDFFAHPLGELQISICNTSTDNVNELSIFKNVIERTENGCNYLQFTKDLTALVARLREYKESPRKEDVCRQEKLKRDVKPIIELPMEKFWSFKELSKIIENGNTDQLKSILLIQANVIEIQNNDGGTLLMEATRYNKPQIVQILIDAGSDVNAVEKNKINAYHYSACVGHEKVLQVLICHDVTSINKAMMYGWTPLHFASKVGHIECVKLILSVPHIDVNIQNNNNETAYDVANNDTIKLLIDGHHKQ